MDCPTHKLNKIKFPMSTNDITVVVIMTNLITCLQFRHICESVVSVVVEGGSKQLHMMMVRCQLTCKLQLECIFFVFILKLNFQCTVTQNLNLPFLYFAFGCVIRFITNGMYAVLYLLGQIVT